MTQAFLERTDIAQQPLFHLENECVMANNVHREYRNEFMKIGDSLTIRKPVKFTPVSGATMTAEDIADSSITFQISSRYHVAMQILTADLTTKCSAI